MRVGEKEISEQAAIVARHADLFTRPQLEALARGRGRAATERARARRRGCASRARTGIVVRELAEREDALENALLAARVPWQGEELPLRTAQARLADEPRVRGPRRARRSRARRLRRRSTTSAARCSPRANELAADVTGHRRPGRAQRGREGDSAPRRSSTPSTRARVETHRRRSRPHASAGSTACSGPSARRRPSFAHVAWMRRLSPLEDDVHEGALGAGVRGDAPRARLRPRGGAGDPARSRGSPAEVAARVRDRRPIRRASST